MRLIANTCGADEAIDINAQKERAVASNHQHYGPLGNVFFRPMVFEKAGDVVDGHTHNFDHVSFLWHGAVHLKAFQVDAKGERSSEPIERSYKAPARILIKKHMSHAFTALEDHTQIDCIFAVRDFEGNVTDAWNGDMTPYV